LRNGELLQNILLPPLFLFLLPLPLFLYGPWKDQWPPHKGGCLILFRHSVGILWTSDQPVTKASNYTGQHNTERRGQTSMPWAGFEPRSQRQRPASQTTRPLGAACKRFACKDSVHTFCLHIRLKHSITQTSAIYKLLLRCQITL
jgi:hypothetical protein